MSTSPTSPTDPPRPPASDRRTASGSSLRRVRDLLGRPLTVERRAGQLQVVLVERRASPAAPTLEALREALRERLLAQENRHAARVMRHLVAVHDALGRKGWASVEALPATVLDMALVQAEILADTAPTPTLAPIVERLRSCRLAAGRREELAACAQDTEPAVLITEATHEEFDAMTRSWVGSVPPAAPRKDD